MLKKKNKRFLSIFSSYLPSSGIAPCVGTAPYGYVTVTPPHDAALLASSRVGTDLGS